MLTQKRLTLDAPKTGNGLETRYYQNEAKTLHFEHITHYPKGNTDGHIIVETISRKKSVETSLHVGGYRTLT